MRKSDGAVNLQERPTRTLTTDLAYFVGAYLSDGYIGPGVNRNKYRFALSVVDKDFAEAVRDSVDILTGRSHKLGRATHFRNHNKNARDQWTVRFCDAGLLTWTLNATRGKGRLPPSIWTADRDAQLHLLAGLMDGDGWISQCRTRPWQWMIGFCCNRGGLLQEIDALLEERGVIIRARRPRSVNRRTGSTRPMELRLDHRSFIEAGCFFKMGRKADRLEKLRGILRDHTPDTPVE